MGFPFIAALSKPSNTLICKDELQKFCITPWAMSGIVKFAIHYNGLNPFQRIAKTLFTIPKVLQWLVRKCFECFFPTHCSVQGYHRLRFRYKRFTNCDFNDKTCHLSHWLDVHGVLGAFVPSSMPFTSEIEKHTDYSIGSATSTSWTLYKIPKGRLFDVQYSRNFFSAFSWSVARTSWHFFRKTGSHS